jgi:hypothetical protein
MAVKTGWIKKGKRLYSVLKLKCPRCHRGDLFTVANPWKLKRVLDMPKRCPVCGQDFVIEPGFYTGALWTSYPIVILIDLLLLTPVLFFPDDILAVVLAMIVISLLLQPVVMRLGRAIWINMFVKFDPRFG